MATSEVEICNLALSKLGASSIVSLSQDTIEAIACLRVFNALRDAVLYDFPWDFALARKELSRLSKNDAWDYNYAYQLPVDPYCLRVVETDGDKNYPWIVEGRVLYTNKESIKIKYITKITDTTKYNPMFDNMLATLIASDLALALTGDSKTATDLINKYLLLLEEAKGASSQNSYNYKAEDLGANEFVEARY